MDRKQRLVWLMDTATWTIAFASFGALLITVYVASLFGSWIEANPIMRAVLDVHLLAPFAVWVVGMAVVFHVVSRSKQKVPMMSDRQLRVNRIGFMVPMAIALFDFGFDVFALLLGLRMGVV